MTTGDLIFLISAGGAAVYVVQQKLANDQALATAAATIKPTSALDRVASDVEKKLGAIATVGAKAANEVVTTVSNVASSLSPIGTSSGNWRPQQSGEQKSAVAAAAAAATHTTPTLQQVAQALAPKQTIAGWRPLS
jgi:hypothetical protein